MLTRMAVRNFKLFDEVEIELGERVIFVGPNNSGKSSALQALALWHTGVRRWVEKRGNEKAPKERAGVAINRKDLIALPVPVANLLWRDLHVREGFKDGEKKGTHNILIGIDVEGIDSGKPWKANLEFDYANEESIYCRSPLGPDGTRLDVPSTVSDLKLAYLPPMSGLAASETRLDQGAIGVRIGEGRTAEVLRNLCWQVSESSPEAWKNTVDLMRSLFGVELDEPAYVKARGEITMSFRTGTGVRLDLSASGRGQQQTLLLLAHMAANPGSILLLDEPDAHLEVLRQRQIYQVLSDAATETGSQIIAASHSEVLLDEAADRDVVVAFLGRPHRINDRGQQLRKSLKEIGFEDYMQAEENGWVLYLEGSTDLAILRSFSQKLDHPAKGTLERPFVHYVSNQPSAAQRHFYGLREAKPDLVGLAIFDRLESSPPADPNLMQTMWARREVENYLCTRRTLAAYAEKLVRDRDGELFSRVGNTQMDEAVAEIENALRSLGKPSPWDADAKVSDDFLTPLFAKFFARLGLPNLMSKTNFHVLAPYLPTDEVDPEIKDKLDLIIETAGRARLRGDAGLSR